LNKEIKLIKLVIDVSFPTNKNGLKLIENFNPF